MISKEELQDLAELAHLELSEAEAEVLRKDISNILEYVGQVSTASERGPISLSDNEIGPRNVMREDAARGDGDPLAGKREVLLKALPKCEGDYAVTRKIIEK